MLQDNHRLRPLLSDLQELLKVATKARDALPLPSDFSGWAEKYTPCDDEFWTLREDDEMVGDLYDHLDRVIGDTQDSLDYLLATGKRMAKKGGKV